MKTLVLYDAASGDVPGEPLMSFRDFPPGMAVPTYAGGVTVMDTTPAGMNTYSGWVSSGGTTPGFPILERSAGFQVNWSMQLENEAHDSNHRAGFSVILLSNDGKGIELAFWQNEIWAQNDDTSGRLFRHGEGTAFSTTTELISYQLAILDDTYTLIANTSPILRGPVRDYSTFDGFPDPYETPNFLFLGDDTTAAQARIRLSFVSVAGTESATPTAESTATSSLPPPTASPAPLPSSTSMPTPIPAGRGFEFCPSGWLLVVMVGIVMVKRIGRVKQRPARRSPGCYLTRFRSTVWRMPPLR